MTTDLSNQVVAIAGASSGIGEATALACVEAGASAALAARPIDRIEYGIGAFSESLRQEGVPLNVRVNEVLGRPTSQLG